jgi:hypothetical protein
MGQALPRALSEAITAAFCPFFWGPPGSGDRQLPATELSGTVVSSPQFRIGPGHPSSRSKLHRRTRGAFKPKITGPAVGMWNSPFRKEWRCARAEAGIKPAHGPAASPGDGDPGPVWPIMDCSWPLRQLLAASKMDELQILLHVRAHERKRFEGRQDV